MKRRLITAMVAVGLVTAPGVAQAAVIGGSNLNFSTSGGGWVYATGRWKGPSTGKAKVCGDVVGSSTGYGSDMTIYRDIPFQPDPWVTYTTLWYYQPYACGSLAATSTSGYYYTAHYRIKEKTPHNGYVRAEY